MKQQKITPFLWFDGKAEEAMNFYVSIFGNSKAGKIMKGPVDRLWERLSAGGEKSRCGWLKDKYGLSWQIIPSVLGKLLQDKDREKAGRVMQAMMQMDKIDIKRLKQAYAG
jgi:predicted 3-demethylubiquinone-9 3-methyltransferase (glyoxalase superfamily)